MEKLLTSNQVAEMVGVIPNTVAIWRCEKKGPAYIKQGMMIRYRLSDVEKWIEARMVIPGQK